MRIVVASGKGGTGKTTVATSLALSLPQAQFVDADAEEPNAHLFLHPRIEHTVPVHMMVPEIDPDSCTYCGKCAEFCHFNALAVVKRQVLVFPELCHGCGGCLVVCPERAVREVQRQIGEVEIGNARGMRFVQGRLRPGEPSAVRIVQRELAEIESDTCAVVDAPPGTACAVVEVIGGADFCLLVTEPTPFGLHDMVMAADAAKELGVPAGVIINRSGRRDALIEEGCRERGLPTLMRIPFRREIAEAYSRGRCLVDAFPEYGERFRGLFGEIRRSTPS
ncbi:MAG: ATP-binding protein [Armatimonadota bacterium]|nr:MAG: ATP-binding protein [Armatimonadota bacterium]